MSRFDALLARRVFDFQLAVRFEVVASGLQLSNEIATI
jgi:hypothetical protein